MDQLPAIVLCVACVLTCTRLLLFRRAGLRYRFGVSFLAWVLTASTGSIALDVFIHGRLNVTWGEVGIASVLCVLTFMARGNVAHIMRMQADGNEHPAPR